MILQRSRSTSPDVRGHHNCSTYLFSFQRTFLPTGESVDFARSLKRKLSKQVKHLNSADSFLFRTMRGTGCRKRQSCGAPSLGMRNLEISAGRSRNLCREGLATLSMRKARRQRTEVPPRRKHTRKIFLKRLRKVPPTGSRCGAKVRAERKMNITQRPKPAGFQLKAEVFFEK